MGQVDEETDVIGEGKPAAVCLFVGVEAGVDLPGGTTRTVSGGTHPCQFSIHEFGLAVLRHVIQVGDGYL